MTIQVSVMNGYGLAMASDRHVYRGGSRSSGDDVKVIRLHGDVPGALMTSGPFAMFGQPVARLALRIEGALARARERRCPEALAEAVLEALGAPFEGPASDDDAELLIETTDHVMEHVLADGSDAMTGLSRLLAELETAPSFRDRHRIEQSARQVWERDFSQIRERSGKPHVVRALHEVPELCGRAVVGAFGRDWRKAAELFVSVGLCCPATGVPVLIAVRAWRGLGRRLQIGSRLDAEYEMAWKAGRTVLIAQGSGAGIVDSMIDGVADGHWNALTQTEKDAVRPRMNVRWDSAHARLAVANPRELASVATGLVRGAEVIGHLTRDGERSVLGVDCAMLTPHGATQWHMACADGLVPGSSG